ncbi:hypothetical protein HELRODRAFT_159338 [Helobdella robusta]|uniref:Uncharacterized protein n=1 Tax=Helobdella robusta TaxID=6412 RepID=T1ENW8_HELRO|nr:hypothetical protein HELRODRAFT_159338 [Helobdella robusta]ESO12755.1 hypothetical protein HELRODRAFT_159338 [Helobdella robusta]
MRKSQEKTLAFREVSEKTLFDISACKCGEDFDNCFCKNKVPKRERDFLTDQRTVRKMIIGNTDKKISQSLQKSLARKAKEEARLSKIEGPCAKKQKCDNLAFDEVEEIKQINFPPDSSEEYKPSTPSQLRRPSPSNFRKSVKLPNLAQIICCCSKSVNGIKSVSSVCDEGSNHFFGIIKKCRYLPEELKNLLNPVLQRNAYFAHPENILLSMLADEQKHIRELALRRILKCRANDATLNTVRVFKVPKLNFDAINYYDMIDWHATEITEPPLTKDITTEALEQMIMDIPNNIEFLKLPCHTQAVERMIKLVTEASLSVCGEKARDGFIRTKLASQNDIPKFETKKHFII